MFLLLLLILILPLLLLQLHAGVLEGVVAASEIASVCNVVAAAAAVGFFRLFNSQYVAYT